MTGPRDKPSDRPSDDAVWREIVANYGDRPVVDAYEDLARVEPQSQPAPVEEHPELTDDGAQVERFVPPPPPPLPRVPGDRLAAWLGVLLSPVLLLVVTVFRISLPAILAWLLVGAFLGGFGYLVSQMPRGPRDPFDDGAVL